MKNEIECGNLSETEMRLVEEFDERLADSTLRLREERVKLAARNDELELLLAKRRAFVERLEALREEIRVENENFRRESERLLAA